MAIRLQGFGGEIPRQEPFYLPDTAAEYAINAAMRGGSLTPFRGATAQDHLFTSNMQSIYLHGAEWLGWAQSVDAVPGPVAQDRLYITQASGTPQMWVDGATMALRIPNPTQKPAITIASGTVNDDLAEDVVYAFTWVTAFGEETAPSPLSNILLWSPGCTVNISSLPITAPVVDRQISGKRIYRAVTSATGATELFFVAEIAVTASTYTHNIATVPVAEAITTHHFNPVPTNLRGLTAMPNGMMAGFAGKELYFCEPYQPHAWPMAYMQRMNDTIIGLAAFGTTLAVLTTGQPYIVQGMHPEQMAMQKMEQPFPCMSKAGIVDMGYSAIYPSTDGLVMVSEQGAQLLSESVWTREQWLAMQPTSMIAGRIGHLYGFSYTPTSGPRQLILIDPNNPQLGILRSDEAPLTLYTHVESGSTFFLGADRRSVRTFDHRTIAKKSYTWRSKPYRLPMPESFGAVRIETDGAVGETVSARIYADGVLIRTVTTPNSFERLPAGRAQTWQIELTGTATVFRVAVARTLQELAV